MSLNLKDAINLAESTKNNDAELCNNLIRCIDYIITKRAEIGDTSAEIFL